MGVVIRLLGRPRIERGGAAPSGPRGNKAWGLLAYLLLCDRPPSRRQLTDLLFSEAEDPLAVLRWNLAELRRALGQPDAFTGDPVSKGLRAGISADVQRVLSAGPDELASVGEFDGELLEGISFPANPAFDAWLLPQRRRVAMAVEAVLRERVLLDLAAGRLEEAPQTAARLVSANPLEEGHHELLIRALLAVGDRAGACRQVASCEKLFRRELGSPPSMRLRDLVQLSAAAPSGLHVGGVAAAQAQLQAGRAALTAGAVEAGIEFLRRASREASSTEDTLLQARVLLALGGGLVHTTRGHEEGAAVLHKAAKVAMRHGAASLAATAYREIGFIDVQAGRRERAEIWLARAEQAAEGSSEELASIDGVRGMNLSDAARYPEALEALNRSIEYAYRCGGKRQVAFSASLVGRVHLLRGDPDAAREALALSLRQIEDSQWIAFQPWPETLIAEMEILDGHLEPARRRLEHAFTIACQLGDSCWEGATARGLGVADAHAGKTAEALAWLTDARARCIRVQAPWQWMHGWILNALSAAALSAGNPRGAEWVQALETLSQRAGMRELLVYASLHRHRLGDARALQAARLLAAEIGSRPLERLTARA